jgi:methylthioribose-1-phosphate isomerase
VTLHPPMTTALEFRADALWLLDQTLLPAQATVIECRDYRQVAQAIRTLSVRGAPAIGLAAAFGSVLAAQSLCTEGVDSGTFRAGLLQAMEELRQTRPTAVNLAWALDRMRSIVGESVGQAPDEIVQALTREADRMLAEDEAANRLMGRHGARLISDEAQVLTHCNTGALATGAFGTAFGVIRTAHEQGKNVHVWVDETRPLLQGARLTTWELTGAGIPFTLIVDSMAAHFMARGAVDLVIVGADRIAANGDTANKIGTYGLAVLAQAHGIPFYVAAPVSTIDLSTPSGSDIPIEERDPEELTRFGGVRTSAEGTGAANPAFDVTPAGLIAGIVTECGILRPPFRESIVRAAGESSSRRASIGTQIAR